MPSCDDRLEIRLRAADKDRAAQWAREARLPISEFVRRAIFSVIGGHGAVDVESRRQVAELRQRVNMIEERLANALNCRDVPPSLARTLQTLHRDTRMAHDDASDLLEW